MSKSGGQSHDLSEGVGVAGRAVENLQNQSDERAISVDHKVSQGPDRRGCDGTDGFTAYRANLEFSRHGGLGFLRPRLLPGSVAVSCPFQASSAFALDLRGVSRVSAKIFMLI